jgi:hypothetical protein
MFAMIRVGLVRGRCAIGAAGAGRDATAQAIRAASDPAREAGRYSGTAQAAAPGAVERAIWTAAGWLAFASGLAGEFLWRWPHLVLR